MAVKWIAIGLVLLFATVTLIPLGMMFTGSLKGLYEYQGAASRVLPRTPTLENYAALLNYPTLRWFGNSAFIAVVGTVMAMSLSVSVAFGVAKYSFRGSSLILGAIVLSIVMPAYATTIPSYIIARGIGLYNSLWAVIIPSLFDAGAVWFLIKFMRAIPNDLVGMGKLDGLGPFGLLWHVIVPMATPAIAALSSMRLVASWQNYLWPMIMLRKRELLTLPVGVREVIFLESFHHDNWPNPGIGLAGAVVVTIPGIILFLLTQKYFVKGLFNKAGD